MEVEIKGLLLGTNKDVRKERAEMRIFIGFCPYVSPGTMTSVQLSRCRRMAGFSDSSKDRNGEGSQLIIPWIDQPRNGQIRKPGTEKT